MAILTVTINPAVDISTNVERIVSGSKLRCGPSRYDPGGGGINVSRAIAKLGGDSRAFVAIGGTTGERLKELLEAEAIHPFYFTIDKHTRQSLAVTERASGEQYRFVLPGPDWDRETGQALLAALSQVFESCPEPVRYIVASGSLPPGLPDDFYGAVVKLADKHGARTLLDTSGKALSAIARAQSRPPYIWVMDNAEANQIGACPIRDMDALEELACDLQQRGLAEIVVASLKEGGAVAVSADEKLRMWPPKVDVVSKVGAGDSFVAGMVMKLESGASLREACAYAVAAAASAVTTPATELCDEQQADHYYQLVLNGEV